MFFINTATHPSQNPYQLSQAKNIMKKQPIHLRKEYSIVSILLTVITCVALITLQACKKDQENIIKTNSDPAEQSTTAKKGGGGGGGNGGGTTTGFIRNILSGNASRLISGKTDSIWVNFTKAAPSSGWTLNLSSSDAVAAIVPSTYPVPAGATTVHPPVRGGNISNAKTVTLSVSLLGQTQTTSIKVFPLTATFPAPQLQSPGNGVSFKSREIVTFDWNDNNNAYGYELQIADNTSFQNLVLHIITPNSIYPASYFNGFGKRYWRVRFVDASDNPGPWSAVRTFEVKQK